MKSKLLSLQILAFATFAVYTIFVWQGNKGFSLWDEGFLWYGAQRVMLGEVPIRDFLAYDPGRYYWAAAFMTLQGDNGIMALRAAVAIFQMIGLLAGLLLLVRTERKQHFCYLLLSAITLMAWMFPRHKLFDISLSILLLCVLAFLIQNPTRKRYFFAGLCVGLAAVFGRNHGMYGVAGSVGVMVWLNIKRLEGPGLVKGGALWAAGVVIGYTPILLMAWFMPGFAGAFWESIRFLFEMKSTNIPLPVPWPWRVNFSSASLGDVIRGVLVGLFFIATVVFGVLSIAWVVRKKLQNKHVTPALVAAAFLTIPYAHFAYSRADINHLAQGIFPFLIGCLALLVTQPAKVKWPLTLMLCAASLWVMHVFHPGWQCQANKRCVEIKISGKTLEVDADTANDVALLRKLSAKYTPNGQPFVVAPFWPGAYALLDRKSPMWAIYPIVPRGEEYQLEEIERIRMADPEFVLIFDFPLDGRDDLRFRNSNSIINHFVESEFQQVDNETNNPAYLLFVKNKSQKEGMYSDSHIR